MPSCLRAFLLIISGCAAAPSVNQSHAMATGQYGEARLNLARHQRSDLGDRNYLLDRLRLGLATLADGHPRAAEGTFIEIFDRLRTQGINADKTVASIVINEGVRFWKGEPFEQAMAYHYVALHFGIQGDWDNVRAAEDNALFHLRDFGTDASGRPLNNEAIVERAVRAGAHAGSLERYTARESNFALAYLMSTIANRQLRRDADADEHAATLLRFRPDLAPLVRAFREGRYNTVLVVDFGQGPKKIRTGPVGVVAAFAPITPSDDARLLVTGNGTSRSYRQVLDLNALAADHRWNNLEEMRMAKSQIGSLMIGGGAVLASGAASQDSEARWAGLGLILAGAAARAGAAADTRHCELLPQRVYVVPALIRSRRDRITLQVEGTEVSRLVLTGLEPPAGPAAALRYVRLLTYGPGPPTWATSGTIYYASEHAPKAGIRMFPYILGGHCVRRPTHQVLDAYQEDGYLMDLTLPDLQDLYRAEGLRWNDDDGGAQPGRHVLEGGRSLAAPPPGTAGFARLFCRRRGRYVPRSDRVRRLAARLSEQYARMHEKNAKISPMEDR